MKKSILILAAATSVIFAACGGNSAEGEYSQAQLDSIKQASVDSAANAIKAQNDSTLNAEAAAAARTADSLRVIDSVFNAGNKKTTTKTTTVKKSNNGTGTHTETKTETTVETKPTQSSGGGLKSQSDQNKQQPGGLKAKSDQAKQEQQKQSGGLKSKSDQAKQNQ